MRCRSDRQFANFGCCLRSVNWQCTFKYASTYSADNLTSLGLLFVDGGRLKERLCVWLCIGIKKYASILIFRPALRLGNARENMLLV